MARGFSDRRAAGRADRFDIRRFHNAVLDGDALPVLERCIDDCIAATAASR